MQSLENMLKPCLFRGVNLTKNKTETAKTTNQLKQCFVIPFEYEPDCWAFFNHIAFEVSININVQLRSDDFDWTIFNETDIDKIFPTPVAHYTAKNKERH